MTAKETGAGRYTALLGLLAVVLVLVAILGLGGNTPDTSDGPLKIAHFYRAHSSQQEVAALMLALGGVALLLFGAGLRERLSGAATRSAWLPVVTTGLAVTAAGMMISAGVHFALADDADNLTATSLATMNSLDGAGFFAIFGGLAVLLGAIAVCAWGPRSLPRAFTVTAIVFAIVCVTPVAFIGGFISLLWIGALSIYLLARPAAPADEAAALEEVAAVR